VTNDGGYVLFVLVDLEGDPIFGESLTPGALAGVKDWALGAAYGVLSRRLGSRVHDVLYAIETPEKPLGNPTTKKFVFHPLPVSPRGLAI
jgi:hypothetical protein